MCGAEEGGVGAHVDEDNGEGCIKVEKSRRWKKRCSSMECNKSRQSAGLTPLQLQFHCPHPFRKMT